MRHARLFLTVLAAAALTAAAAGATLAGDEESAVKETIANAYVKGVHIDRDVEAVKSGFHPSFIMFIKKDDGISAFTLDAWVESIAKKRAEEPQGPAYEVTHEIPMVSISGDAAVAKVMIFRDGVQIYSDYMSLYRFSDGWKIVGKIYYSHRG